jgi:fructose-1,6-bisphosphatase I
MHTGTTLTQFIIEEQRHIAGATGEFTGLLNDVVVAIKTISNAVNKGALIGVMGALDSEKFRAKRRRSWT